MLADPRGDDNGPGSYRYPDHPAFRAGSFDLEQVSLARDGDDWLLEVQMAGAIERAPVFVSRDDRRELHLQTVDLYFRLDGAGASRSESLPGREVRIEPGWQRAVVLSPVPRLLRRDLERGGALEDVFVPLGLRLSGRKLKARVPVTFLGSALPTALAVLVSGTRFSSSFEVVGGKARTQGLTMPVAAASAECRLDDADEALGCRFHGCAPCEGHPQVIDILAPAGSQQRALSSYAPGRPARVTMMPVASAEAADHEVDHGRSRAEGDHQALR